MLGQADVIIENLKPHAGEMGFLGGLFEANAPSCIVRSLDMAMKYWWGCGTDFLLPRGSKEHYRGRGGGPQKLGVAIVDVCNYRCYHVYSCGFAIPIDYR